MRRNCHVTQVIKGKIEGRIAVTERRVRRGKQLLDDLKETKGYWKLQEEALDRTVWRNSFGRDCGSVGMIECIMNDDTFGTCFAFKWQKYVGVSQRIKEYVNHFPHSYFQWDRIIRSNLVRVLKIGFYLS